MGIGSKARASGTDGSAKLRSALDRAASAFAMAFCAAGIAAALGSLAAPALALSSAGHASKPRDPAPGAKIPEIGAGMCVIFDGMDGRRHVLCN